MAKGSKIGGLKNAGAGFGWDNGRRRCLACHRPIVWGERCETCKRNLRDRQRRKRR